MNQEWVDKKNAEARKEYARLLGKLITDIKYSPVLSPDEKSELLEAFALDYRDKEACIRWVRTSAAIKPKNVFGFGKWIRGEYNQADIASGAMVGEPHDLLNDGYQEFFMKIAGQSHPIRNPYDKYLDSEWRFFDGDILITDPCYLIDWEIRHPNHGRGYVPYEDFGIGDFYRDTIYGDWSCATINSDTNEVIGRFCADGADVGVFYLEDVLKANPDYDDHIGLPHMVTLIKDFCGNVKFFIDEEKWSCNGEEMTDYTVRIVGIGENSKTGEPINFYTTQTGA